MNLFDEEVLESVIPQVRSWELLNTPEYVGRLTMTQYYDLLLDAGYTESTANKLAVKHGQNRLDAGLMM